MLGSIWYHSLTRKLVIISGQLFNDIVIRRLDKTGKKVQTIQVPISYSQKRKWEANIAVETNRNVEIILPRLGFALTSYSYDSSRQSGPLNKLIGSRGAVNEKSMNYNPVPYKVGLEVYAMTKNQDDMCQIMEQIVPYFTPSFNMKTNLIPELDHTFDIVFTLKSVSEEQIYDGDLQQRQQIMMTFNFEVDFWYFGPTSKEALVKKITLSLGDLNHSYSVVPGLTANGTPTSSANSSISNLLIKETDDYGFISYPNPETFDDS